jgi:hypothetical protein
MPHLYASDPGPSSQRGSKLTACPHCGANGAACDSLYWLDGRTCCRPCDGTHESQDVA